MVMTTLYARQQNRHICIEQSFGLCGRGQGWVIWENGIETCKLSHVKRIAGPSLMHDIQGAQGWCTGMTQRDGMGREVGGGSGWGPHVHPWWIHVNVWQNQYNK